MRLVKLNRRDFLEFEKIEKAVKKGNILWVYRNDGVYPKIIKTEFGIDRFFLNCVNAKVTAEEIVKFKKKCYTD